MPAQSAPAFKRRAAVADTVRMGDASPTGESALAALQRTLADGSAGLHRALMRDIPGTAFFAFDADRRVVFAEGAALRRRGLDPERDVEGRLIAEVFPGEFAHVSGAVASALGGDAGEREVALGERVVWLRTAPILDAAGAVTGALGIAIDVSARRRTEASLRDRVAQQSAVAALGRRALEGVSVSRLLDEAAANIAEHLAVDRVSIVKYDEESGVMLGCVNLGWPTEVPRGTVAPLTDEARRIAATLTDGPFIVDEVTADMPHGTLLLEQGITSSITVLVGRGERPFGVISALTTTPRRFSVDEADFLQSVANLLWDAIERHEADADNRHAALHDALTGLPNRRLLTEHLEQALGRARDTRAAVAVLFVDVDGFKVVNGSLGHSGGDELLRALTPRLRSAARECDTIARIGGDEFVLVCGGVISEEHALELARRVMSALETPFVIDGRHHVVTVSIGVVIDDGHSTPESLLRDADTAMYRAKANGRGRSEVFSPEMRARACMRLRMESELQHAAERGELRVHYQPLFEIDGRQLIGMEALMRWERPDEGLVAPNDFIPVAEETGLIVALGQWILNAATEQLAGWQTELHGIDQLGIAINVSGRQLLTPGFDETVRAALTRSGLSANRLSLEVTESMLMEQTETPMAALAELRRLGVRIVLDDFGTGYSSLSRLKDLPLDALKIDRSFIDRLGDDPDREPIVVAIMSMAHALGLEVIAEGVETERALQRLAALHCEMAQGFLLSRPIPPEQMADMLRRDLTERSPGGTVVPLRRAAT
jgi:diguanylate cyclase (GGDEF)-like protein